MDKYHLRRAVLEALVDSEPAASTILNVLDYPTIAMCDLPRQDVMTEIKGLVERGYARDLRPGRAPLFRITAAGRGQIRRDDDLHEYVWGEYASKFAG